MPLPAAMSAKIAFKAGDKEQPFDFNFQAFSKDAAVPAAAPASAAPGTAAAISSRSSLLSDLKARQRNCNVGDDRSICQHHSRHFRRRTSRSGEEAPGGQAVESPVHQIVAAAFQLDYGDLGDKRRSTMRLSLSAGLPRSKTDGRTTVTL
jgi:hypothetical protein